MHNIFQSHYQQDPQNRFPHIPSIPVSIPVNASKQHDFCFLARYYRQTGPVSPEDTRATAAALLRAVQELEADAEARGIQMTNQARGKQSVRKYFIKRNYSGESCAPGQ